MVAWASILIISILAAQPLGTMSATERQLPPGNGHELTTIIPVPVSGPKTRPETPLAAVDAAVASTLQRSRSKLVICVVALYSALFIACLNATLIATAIPTICKELDSAAGYAWIGGAYLLSAAASGPIWAKTSDIWGRKIILLSAVAGFFFSSIICALSVDMSMLLGGRALQGVAGGGIIQMVMVVGGDLFRYANKTSPRPESRTEV